MSEEKSNLDCLEKAELLVKDLYDYRDNYFNTHGLNSGTTKEQDVQDRMNVREFFI